MVTLLYLRMAILFLTPVHLKVQQWPIFVGISSREDVNLSVKKLTWQRFAIRRDTGSPVLIISVLSLQVSLIIILKSSLLWWSLVIYYDHDLEFIKHIQSCILNSCSLARYSLKWRWKNCCGIVTYYTYYQLSCVFHLWIFLSSLSTKTKASQSYSNKEYNPCIWKCDNRTRYMYWAGLGAERKCCLWSNSNKQ